MPLKEWSRISAAPFMTFFREICRPGQQPFHCRGFLFRSIEFFQFRYFGKEMLEVIVGIQVAGFRCLDNAADDGTGLRTGDRVDYQPVPAPCCKAANRGFTELCE